MSFKIDASEHPVQRWGMETVENAALGAAMTAGFGYLLHVTEVIQMSNPIQGVIFGVTAAVVDKIAEVLFDKLDKENNIDNGIKFAVTVLAGIVVSTGVTVALGFPMTYAAGACLIPAVVISSIISHVARQEMDKWELEGDFYWV